MPELPEAETIARQLHAQLHGRTFAGVRQVRPDVIKSPETKIEKVLPRRRVLRVFRRGKRVLLELDPPALLVFGLGMTGRLTVCPSSAEVENHTHLIACVADSDSELRFRDPRRFGGIWFCERFEPSSNGSMEVPALTFMGIEPLQCSLKQFREVVARKRQIKALLMDQHAVAGLGNIYCDESLHAAGIHPLTAAHRLQSEDVARLFRAIRSVLRRAIQFNGSTLMDYRDADGSEGSFQKLHRVYGRETQPCKTCGASIRRIQAAGRSTHFCPKCQRKRPG